MNQASAPSTRLPAWLRFVFWCLYLAAWTWALLVPYPDAVENAPAEFDFALSVFAKSVHIGAYAAWAILSGWLRLPSPFRWLLLIFLSAHGVATEYCQRFVATRQPSLLDVGFDHVGILLGLGLSWKWWRR